MAIEEQANISRSSKPPKTTEGSRDVVGGLIARLFRPVDNASLVFFRIAFGVTAFFHIWGVLDTERIRRRYMEPPFYFSFPGLDWIKPLPGELMLVLWFGLAFAALLVMLGLFYKQAIIFFFIGHTYAIHLDQSIFWNHYYVVTLFAFLMIFVPANRAHSLDVKLRGLAPSDTTPEWTLWILRGQMAVTYFFAGVAKINSDWIRGHPMDVLLHNEDSFPFISGLFNQHWMVLALAWTGMFFDLLIVPLLLWRRSRPYMFAVAVGFHLINSLIFAIEVFPWFAIVATTLFFDPNWPRKIGLWNEDPAPKPEHQAVPHHWYQLKPRQKAGCILLAFYFVIQCIMPLRHYAYPGNVNFTTEGDLWSWRMLLVDASQNSIFTAKSKTTGFECWLDPDDIVGEGPVYKLGFRPDMMAQFGHYVADQYWERRHERVSVHVYSAVSINGHPWAQIVSPQTDLATVTRRPHNDWILPWDPPIPPVKPAEMPRCDLWPKHGETANPVSPDQFATPD